MMFIYTYDPNAILVDPLHDITKEYILQAYQNIIGHITIRGFKPGLQRLENKASELLQNEMDNRCDHRPQKKEKEQIWITFGGDRLYIITERCQPKHQGWQP